MSEVIECQTCKNRRKRKLNIIDKLLNLFFYFIPLAGFLIIFLSIIISFKYLTSNLYLSLFNIIIIIPLLLVGLGHIWIWIFNLYFINSEKLIKIKSEEVK